MYIPILTTALLYGTLQTAKGLTTEGLLLRTIINGWEPLTIITKYSTLDVAAALDPSLNKIEKVRERGLQYILNDYDKEHILNFQETIYGSQKNSNPNNKNFQNIT